MKSHRILALATSLIAVTLSLSPVSALAQRPGGGRVIYMGTSAAASSSSGSTTMRIIAMAVNNFLWFPA